MSSSHRLALLLAAAATVGVGGCAAGGTPAAGPAPAGPAVGRTPAEPAAFGPLGDDPDTAVRVLGGALRPGVPTVERQVHDGIAFTLTLSPARPGWNLVRVDTTPVAGGDGHHQHREPIRVGTDVDHLRAAASRPGVDGSWARIRLPEGASTVFVGHGPEHRLPFPVDTGSGTPAPASASGPDGPECAAAAVGSLLAGVTPATTCPAEALDPGSAEGLRGVVRTLAERGADAVALRTDSSARGRAAAQVVRAEAARRHLTVVGPDRAPDQSALLVVSGWRPATTALVATARAQQRQVRYEHGVWLAPWLLSPGIVDSISGAVLPLGFDVRGDAAVGYQTALRRLLPGTAPTAAGFVGWSRAYGGRGEVALYAATRTAAMAAAPGHEHHETAVSWFPDGTVTRVSGPLT